MRSGCKCSECVERDMRSIAMLGDDVNDIFYDYCESAQWDFAEELNLVVHGWDYNGGLGGMMRDERHQFFDLRVGSVAGFRFCEDSISNAALILPRMTRDYDECGEELDELKLSRDFRAMVRFAMEYAFLCGKYSS